MKLKVKLPKNIWIAVGAALLSLIITTGVLAATIFTLSVPSTVTVVQYSSGGGGGGGGGSPANTIAVYPTESDANAGTNQITTSSSIAWGNVIQYSNTQKTFWVKNIGTGAVAVSMSSDNLPSGVTLTAPPIDSLAASAVGSITATLAADGTATPAVDVAFNTKFISNGN